VLDVDVADAAVLEDRARAARVLELAEARQEAVGGLERDVAPAAAAAAGRRVSGGGAGSGGGGAARADL
jgi:hypothetical protein